MPTIIRIGGLRVVIYPNDHRPVHVIGNGCEAVFILNCPGGPPQLREDLGFSRPELNKLVNALTAELAIVCESGGKFMTDISERELHEAEARLQTRLAAGPRAIAARYDRRASRIVVALSSGVELAFPPRIAEGLSEAQPDDLGDIEITPSGLGLHFPRLDADLYVPALLQGILGSSAWMAQALGAKGGSSTSALKAAAARANGKLGGRPRLGAVAASSTKPKPKAAKAVPAKPVKKTLAVRGRRVAQEGEVTSTGRPPKGVVGG